jgi:hypothetical protein
MPAYGHSANSQLGLAFEEFPYAFHLVVELTALRCRKLAERLYRDVEFPAGAALVPDSGDYAVDEQHGKVACLTPRQGALGGPAGEELRTWVAAYDVGVKVVSNG